MKLRALFQKYYLFNLLTILFIFLSCGKNSSKPVEIPQPANVGAHAMPAEIAPTGKAPFDFPELKKPVFPDRAISITDKGAEAGVLITSIVNQTITEINQKGGGTVIIPEGHWKSGRIVLKSNVNLHISEGAVIEFPGTAEEYLPTVFTRHEGIEIMGPAAFIYANNENNIAVTGKGKILGPPLDAEIRKRPNGKSVVENDIPVTLPLNERIYDGMEGRTFYRPKTISPINCTNVLIEGVTMERSTLWNVCPIYCENVIIRGITVNSVEVPSGDGIDIESCKNVLIEYCTLNCGDDCFTLKAGRADDGLRVGKPTENVIIRYSLAQNGHGGITCGSETAGVVKNVYAYDCVFEDTRSAIRFKTRRNRGGGTENVYYERMRMININEAFTFNLLGTAMYMGELAERHPPRAINHLTPEIKRIYIKDFIVESSNRFLTANGIPELPLRNVKIENGEVNTKILIREMTDVEGFAVENVNIVAENNEINILDGRNIRFEKVKFTVPGNKVIVNVEGDASKDILFEEVEPAPSVIRDR